PQWAVGSRQWAVGSAGAPANSPFSTLHSPLSSESSFRPEHAKNERAEWRDLLHYAPAALHHPAFRGSFLRYAARPSPLRSE
ncbi:MAG: hypothetical protein LBF81_05090, partial [Prevotellaceae bacterium]|nr:hypothetical protein [Prevotellaceae bacterium]